jgi:aspartate/methionine/tyrosine aminotransferase
MHSNLSFELSPIKAIELAATKLPDVISLAQGIPSFPTPQAIKDFVYQRIQEGKCDKYSLTIGLQELRQEIALALMNEGLKYDPESEIIATAGSIEAITAAIFTSTSPGDEVILPSPSYVSYQGALAMARCKAVFAPLDEDNNFDFSLDAIKDRITSKTSAILFCSPNNPTGTVYSEEKTRALIQLAHEHDLTVIVDEVYKDFYYDNTKHFSPCVINNSRTRVIRVCSFSKAYAMTGWRIGFVHSDQSIMSKLVKYHDAMVTCAPVVSQYAAIAALRYGAPYIEEYRQEFKERRNYTIAFLDSLSHIFDYQMPRAAYFVFPRIKDIVPLARDSKKLAYDILENSRVAVVPGVAFGPSGESHLRITFGRSKEDLENGLSRLGDYFDRAKSNHSRNYSVSISMNTSKLSIRDQVIRKSLATAARIYLLRNKPLIIGIVGKRGKTNYKRAICNLLKTITSCRGNILSYNTEIGLPLSILDIHIPSSKMARLFFPLQLLKQAFVKTEKANILVLEYGITSKSDALDLLKIVKPDWLVVCDTNDDLDFANHDFKEGIEEFISNVTPEQIIWAKQTVLAKQTKEITNDFSADIAEKTAVLLSKRLGL